MTANYPQQDFAMVEIDADLPGGQTEEMKNRLKEWRERRGLTLQKVADHLGTQPPQIHKLESGKLKLKAETLTALAELYKCSPGELLVSKKMGELTTASQITTKLSRNKHKDNDPQFTLDIHKVIEIDVRVGAGGGGEAQLEAFSPDNRNVILREVVRGEWGFPVTYLASEVRIAPEMGRIVEVRGDSMEPTLHNGDRIMVNVADRVPSPPGIFVLWDGLGVIVKRVEYIPGTEPARITISSDNPRAQPRAYERTVDEIQVLGRAQWVARRL